MENITSAQVKEAIDQLAAMTAAASITPEAVASVMEKLRNLTDAERQQIVEVASAYLTEINTKSQEWLNRLLSTGGSADKIVTKNGSNVQTELDTLGEKVNDLTGAEEKEVQFETMQGYRFNRTTLGLSVTTQPSTTRNIGIIENIDKAKIYKFINLLVSVEGTPAVVVTDEKNIVIDVITEETKAPTERVVTFRGYEGDNFKAYFIYGNTEAASVISYANGELVEIKNDLSKCKNDIEEINGNIDTLDANTNEAIQKANNSLSVAEKAQNFASQAKDEIDSLYTHDTIEKTLSWDEEFGYYTNAENLTPAAESSVYRGCTAYVGDCVKVSIRLAECFASGSVGYMLLDANKNLIGDIVHGEKTGTSYSASDIEIVDGAKYIRFNRRTSRATTLTALAKGDKYFDTNIIKDGSLSPSKLAGGSEAIKTINVLNSDKITIVGDSYTESSVCVKNKSYIAKLSLFSDYQFVNFGKSGDIYLGRIKDVRNAVARYGTLPLTEYRPKYTMLCSYTNDLKYMGFDMYKKCLENAISFFRGIGTEPIVCTEYHTENGYGNVYQRDWMREVAKKYGVKFFEIATYGDIVYGRDSAGTKTRYVPFWSGSHPGTRANAIESDGYQMYLEKFNRPMQSIKMFRLRGSYSELDDLMFETNDERARIFKEINVGDTCLQNASDVDNVVGAKTIVCDSEYGKLIQGEKIAFSNASLISCVLPSCGKDLTYLALSIATTDDVSVYVRKTLEAPFPNLVQCANFSIENVSVMPIAGDVYKSSVDGTNYTVLSILTDDDGIVHLMCSGSTASNTSGGTLTKVSGSGDASIGFTYREVGYQSAMVSADTLGHWKNIIKGDDGKYDVSEYINDVVCYDKVHFLIVKNGDFSIGNPSVLYSSAAPKTLQSEMFEFKTNYYSPNTELLPSTTFGTAGVKDTVWNVVPTETFEQQNGTMCYPIKEISSKVNVNDEVSLSANVSGLTYGRRIVLEVWCRYFPDTITEDTFDYNEVEISFASGKVIKKMVNTHWKIVRVSTLCEKNAVIKIASNNKGIEVCYVSLKYED